MSENYYKVYLYGKINNGTSTPTEIYDNPIEIMDSNLPDMALVNPRLTVALNEAGNFEFTMPRSHVFYDAIIPFGSTIAVTEDDEILFIGRPMSPSIDFWGAKTYHCEGALSFLNDVVLYHKEVGENQITAADYFDNVLIYYNIMAGRPDREFDFDFYQYSIFTNAVIYDPDPWDCQTAMEFIKNYLHQFVSGYFYVQYNDFCDIELKWVYSLDSLPFSNQPIQYAVNMLDIAQEGGEIYSAAIAKGGEDDDGKVPYMTSPVQNKKMVNTYGFICKSLEYPDCHTKSALKAYCQTYIEDTQFRGITIEVSAADLHPLNDAYGKYKLLQRVDVNATQLGISVILPITRLEVNLASCIKYATAGESAMQPLTISTAKNISSAITKSENKTREKSKKSSKQNKNNTITGSDGNNYVVDVETDPETGQTTVTATKVPTGIKFTRSKAYLVGDTLNYEDFTVVTFYGDGGNSDVTSACTFDLENGYEFQIEDIGTRIFFAYYSGYSAGTKLKVSAKSGKKLVIHRRFDFSGSFWNGGGYPNIVFDAGSFLDMVCTIESTNDKPFYLKVENDSLDDGTNFCNCSCLMDDEDSLWHGAKVKCTVVYSFSYSCKYGLANYSYADSGTRVVNDISSYKLSNMNESGLGCPNMVCPDNRYVYPTFSRLENTIATSGWYRRGAESGENVYYCYSSYDIWSFE